jgi:hypothetical protein
MNKENEKGHGYAQLEAIIGEIMDFDKKNCKSVPFPNWDFLNNVLSCEKVLGSNKLWFHWGELLIVREGQNIAEEMEKLQDWNTMPDGTIELIGMKKKLEE